MWGVFQMPLSIFLVIDDNLKLADARVNADKTDQKYIMKK